MAADGSGAPDLSAAWSISDAWPVPEYAVAVLHRDAVVTRGDTSRTQRIASVSKPVSAWAVLVAVEEGSVSLDDPVGQTGCTLRHLLAHAGGYPFDGANPISKPGVRRHYSNTGFDLMAAHIEHSTGIAFADYLAEAVFAPLAMSSSVLEGSCARDVVTNVDDLVAFVGEMRSPRLISRELRNEAVSVVYPELAGVVPGLGAYDPCPWGLGIEIKGHKTPHWTAPSGSASTFGHFGGIGTFVWVDPVADVACAMLAERDFTTWGMLHWPSFNDAVLAAFAR